jgi:hypothetical protein
LATVPAAPLLVVYLLGYLVNAIPVPRGLGVLDGGLASALIVYHVPAAVAIGGVLIYHAVALWIPTVLGTLAFIAAQREIRPGGSQTASNTVPVVGQSWPNRNAATRAAEYAVRRQTSPVNG